MRGVRSVVSSLFSNARVSTAVRARHVEDASWLRVRPVYVLRELTAGDGGHAAAAMVVARWLGAAAGLRLLAQPRRGESPTGEELCRLLHGEGLGAWAIKGRSARLEHELRHGRPVIVGVIDPTSDAPPRCRYLVLVGMNGVAGLLIVIDPASGWRRFTTADFQRRWQATGHTTVVAFTRGGKRWDHAP